MPKITEEQIWFSSAGTIPQPAVTYQGNDDDSGDETYGSEICAFDSYFQGENPLHESLPPGLTPGQKLQLQHNRFKFEHEMANIQARAGLSPLATLPKWKPPVQIPSTGARVAMFNRENKKKEMEALALKQEEEGKKGESVMESFGIICYCVMTFFLEICGGWILTVLQDPVLLALAGVGVWAVGHVVEIVCAWAGTILGIILGIVSDWFGEVLGIVVTSLTESVGGKWVLDILGIISTALGAVLGIVSNWWAENLGWEWVDEWI